MSQASAQTPGTSIRDAAGQVCQLILIQTEKKAAFVAEGRRKQ
jgi:hypothetical protein